MPTTYDFDQIRIGLPDVRPMSDISQVIKSAIRPVPEGAMRTQGELHEIASAVSGKLLSEGVEQRSQEEIKRLNQRARVQMKEKWDVDYDETIQDARTSMLRLVDSMRVPEEVKCGLRCQLDAAEFENSGTTVASLLDPDTGLYTVHLSPALVLFLALRLREVFGNEVTSDLLRASIVYCVGHELGHVLGATFEAGESYFDRSAAIKYGDVYMADFPIQYTSEPDHPISDHEQLSLDFMKEERFAGYFSWELLRGLGFRAEGPSDVNRALMSEVYALGLRPVELLYILNDAIFQMMQENIPEHDYRITKLAAMLMGQVLRNTHLAEIYPFDQEAVESIIMKSWKARNS